MIDIEQLKQRRAELVQQRELHQANVHATSGAIAAYDEVIAKASEPEPALVDNVAAPV